MFGENANKEERSKRKKGSITTKKTKKKEKVEKRDASMRRKTRGKHADRANHLSGSKVGRIP